MFAVRYLQKQRTSGERIENELGDADKASEA